MDPNAQTPPLRLMNEPHLPITEAESNPDPTTNHNSSGKNTLLTLASLLILSGIVGITLWLYIQNKQSSNKIPVDQATKKSDENKVTTLTNDPNDVKEINGMKVAGAQNQALVKKYGAICKRFTSLGEALKAPDVTCILDLSDQNLSEIPDEILQLKILNEIILSNNKFNNFPTNLYQLKSLVSIDLTDNNIKELPQDFRTKMPAVRSILLDNNPLPLSLINEFKDLTK